MAGKVRNEVGQILETGSGGIARGDKAKEVKWLYQGGGA